jgi:hypothetical protein
VNWNNEPIPSDRLLYGKYNIDPYLTLDGKVFGARFNHDFENGDYKTVSCQEFTIERIFTETHYFDQFLTIDSFREEQLTDLDVDFRRIYLTFENARGDQATCAMSNLFEGVKRIIRIDSLRDCVLPPGNEFTMYAESRFFKKETRPCGKIIATGVQQSDGTYIPEWKKAEYECDGKNSRKPIEKRFSYATHIEITFTDTNVLTIF